MQIKYSKSALKFLAKLDRKTVDRIRNAIVGLTETPPKVILNLWKDIRTNGKDCESALIVSFTIIHTKTELKYC